MLCKTWNQEVPADYCKLLVDHNVVTMDGRDAASHQAPLGGSGAQARREGDAEQVHVIHDAPMPRSKHDHGMYFDDFGVRMCSSAHIRQARAWISTSGIRIAGVMIILYPDDDLIAQSKSVFSSRSLVLAAILKENEESREPIFGDLIASIRYAVCERH